MTHATHPTHPRRDAGRTINSPPRLGAHVGQDDGGADRVAVDVVLGPLRAHHLHASRDKKKKKSTERGRKKTNQQEKKFIDAFFAPCEKNCSKGYLRFLQP